MLFYPRCKSHLSRALFSCLFSMFIAIVQSPASLMASDHEGALLDWELVPALFRTSYAPLEWKKQHLGWDVDQVISRMRAQLFMEGHPTTEAYRKTLRHFLASFHDFHVFPIFFSTEEATLPFSIMGAEGRYWIAWINRDHLPEHVFHFEVGDELLWFDGKPVQECIDEIRADCFAGGVSQTEQILAEYILTCRSGCRGDLVPQGLVSITVRSAKTQAVNEFQVVWEYEEDILPPTHLVKGKSPHEKKRLPFLDTLMMVHFPEFNSKSDADDEKRNPLAMGKKESFLPPLAKPEEYKGEEGEDFPFYAYTFEHPTTGKTIGFVRIPHYNGGEKEAQAFGELIEYFEKNTSALVIDQLNNPGGKAYYLSALASFLSPEPLNTPHHQFVLTHRKVIEAYKGFQLLKEICSKEATQKLFQEIAEEASFGYPITYQTLLMLRQYYATFLKAWKQGKTLTPPVHVGGLDRIFPHPDFVPYSKPILLLINGLDFSGGDFMAAILRDSTFNGKPRATLFGQRTAGAGGAVETYQYPNQYGVSKIAHTVSIACRSGFPPETGRIENLGVAPDIPYTITQKDIQNGWTGYRQAILDALIPLIEDDEEALEEPHKMAAAEESDDEEEDEDEEEDKDEEESDDEEEDEDEEDLTHRG